MEVRNRPFPFAYYVFWSKSEEATAQERELGIYLVEIAEARYLQKFFDPLFDAADIGISTSDDEIISSTKLDALLSAVKSATRDVETQASEWTVAVGYTFKAHQMEPEAEILRGACRSRLLEFLEGTLKIIQKAIEAGGYVHFGGGG